MTTTIKQNLQALSQAVKANMPIVRKKLSKVGASRAVVFSAAKYYATIEKLAKE